MQGNTVVPYSSKEEDPKAQKFLYMCVLGNTTILAVFAGEEVNHFLPQGQVLLPTSSWQSSSRANQATLGSQAAPMAWCGATLATGMPRAWPARGEVTFCGVGFPST